MKSIVSQNKDLENKIEKSPKAINGYVDKEGVYQLSDFQLEKLAKSRKQFEAGDFLTEEEMDKKIEEWLNEK